MQTRTVEQIEDWDSRPFSGGYASLHELADTQFSGAVSAGQAWLFMLNGRVVGVFEGALDDFDAHDGTAYTAPDPSLPLLFTMLELGGETRANYYTNETPLTEADEMLSEGNFVGYVELSENVLSGDYYTVYYGGRSMSTAFVGASERLHTGDEAFERAADEVGIYEVVEVDLEIVDIPELDEPESEPTAVGAGSTGSTTESTDSTEPPASEPGRPTPEPEPTADEPKPRADEPEARTEPRPEAGPSTDEPAEAPSVAPEARSEETSRSAAASTDSSDDPEPTARDPDERRTDDVFSEEEQWREAKSIPSLDPDRTDERRTGGSTSGPSRSASSQAAAQKARTQRQDRDESGKPTPGKATRRTQQQTANRSTGDRARSSEKGSDASAKLRSALERAKTEIQRLQTEVGELESERAELEEEQSELEDEIRRLRSELREARESSSSGDAGAAEERQLSPAAALDGTNLFVRYGSKGKATLETAHAGRADKDEVNANLKLEHHTQFDADTVSVEGHPFEEFLYSSIQYNFVRWVVEDLLYEIRDTGRQTGLGDVYDALPRIDRAEVGGEVTMTTTVDGEERERTESFDVILRDRMGNPLLVANLNDSRDPATGDVMASLVESTNAVCERHDELGAAFYVTASFFEPDALETAAEATSGGLLSREKRDSYVKFARKRGYHLCLVESRAGEFHVNVPEL